MPFDRDDVLHIDQMLDAAQRLNRHLDAAPEDWREANEAIFDAICMCLVRIGEGARLLSVETKASLPHYPWPDIVNLRHRIAHGYSHLKPEIIWRTARHSVPDFARALSDLRARMDLS